MVVVVTVFVVFVFVVVLVVVVVLVISDAEFLSKFPQNWIMLRPEKMTQYGSFIPDYS